MFDASDVHSLNLIFKNSPSDMFCKNSVLKDFAIFTGKHLCWSLFLSYRPQDCNFIKKEAPAKVFSCEFYKIFKNIFLSRTPPVADAYILSYIGSMQCKFVILNE